MSDRNPAAEPAADGHETAGPREDARTQATSKERVFVGTGLVWGLIIGLLLAAVVVILAAQNTTPIDIDFLGWTFSTSLIVLILGGLLIGVVLDEIFGLVFRARRRRSLRDREQVERLSN